MLSFKEYLLIENKYPTWVKGSALFLTLKIRSIESQIQSEKDLGKKMNLIATQMKFNSILSTLGIAVDSKDRSLIKMN